jgi:hypothetical protein
MSRFLLKDARQAFSRLSLFGLLVQFKDETMGLTSDFPEKLWWTPMSRAAI